jgi:hypothetical protein
MNAVPLDGAGARTSAARGRLVETAGSMTARDRSSTPPFHAPRALIVWLPGVEAAHLQNDGLAGTYGQAFSIETSEVVAATRMPRTDIRVVCVTPSVLLCELQIDRVDKLSDRLEEQNRNVAANLHWAGPNQRYMW